MDLEKDLVAFDGPDYHFFWGGHCSQWAISPFIEFDTEFNCAEQFMMAAKAKVFGDERSYEKIMATNSPRDQKALGRKVKDFDHEKWALVARDFVTLANYDKFTQNPEFYEFLEQHRDKFFVEASPYDKIWGIGLGESAEGIENPANWQGKNWLGQCINQARDYIFLEDTETPEALRKKLDWREAE